MVTLTNKSYVVIFNSNEGSNVESQTVTESGKATSSLTPTRSENIGYYIIFVDIHSYSSVIACIILIIAFLLSNYMEEKNEK